MSSEHSRFYEFGAFRLDRVHRQLLREGASVSLPAKSMEVLLVLVENAGRVLERAELIERVWPDAAGADGSLAVTISALRKVLGDRPDGGSYIETMPRQGYRLAASVVSLPEQPESPVSETDAPARPGLHERESFNAGTAAAKSGRWRITEHLGLLAVVAGAALVGAVGFYALLVWRSS